MFYSHALKLFQELEDGLLRAASHFLLAYCGQLHTAGKPLEIPEVDRLSILEDLWEFEAQFCAARHATLVAYMQVCGGVGGGPLGLSCVPPGTPRSWRTCRCVCGGDAVWAFGV